MVPPYFRNDAIKAAPKFLLGDEQNAFTIHLIVIVWLLSIAIEAIVDDVPSAHLDDAVTAVDVLLRRVSAVVDDRHVILSFFPPFAGRARRVIFI